MMIVARRDLLFLSSVYVLTGYFSRAALHREAFLPFPSDHVNRMRAPMSACCHIWQQRSWSKAT